MSPIDAPKAPPLRDPLAGVPRYALTFDDGPGPTTAELLDILRDAGVRATFFVLGKNVEAPRWCEDDVARTRALVERTIREGHVVGNHTFSHAKPAAYLDLPADLRRADEVIRACRRAAGAPVDAPIPVRLPYGIRIVEETVPVRTGTLQVGTLDPRLPVLASLGRAHVHWTSDFGDWTLGEEEAPELARRMLAHVESIAALGLDAVLDLHDAGTGSDWGWARPATAAAVAAFLAEAARRGWASFTVPR